MVPISLNPPTLLIEQGDIDQAATLKPEEVLRLEVDQESFKIFLKLIKSVKTSHLRDLEKDSDQFIL
jgi:hypothetical protein